jgi:hypothetical protein
MEEIVFEALSIEANTHMILKCEGILDLGKSFFSREGLYTAKPLRVRHGICLLALIHLMQGTTDIKTASALNLVQNQHRYVHGH